MSFPVVDSRPITAHNSRQRALSAINFDRGRGRRSAHLGGSQNDISVSRSPPTRSPHSFWDDSAGRSNEESRLSAAHLETGSGSGSSDSRRKTHVSVRTHSQG